MNRKTITIQTNTIKKGKPDQRSFACQIIELPPRRIYVLEETKNTLTRKRFTVVQGCKIIDDGVSYTIEDIEYWKKPMYPFLVVFSDPKTV